MIIYSYTNIIVEVDPRQKAGITQIIKYTQNILKTYSKYTFCESWMRPAKPHVFPKRYSCAYYFSEIHFWYYEWVSFLFSEIWDTHTKTICFLWASNTSVNKYLPSSCAIPEWHINSVLLMDRWLVSWGGGFDRWLWTDRDLSCWRSSLPKKLDDCKTQCSSLPKRWNTPTLNVPAFRKAGTL